MQKNSNLTNVKTVAELLVEYLERRKVKHIFGLCGHTNIAVLSALETSPIEFITVRHEQIASHAADAYARVTGKASVVLSHLSPGLTNCATGVANAALDCTPMVVIAGDIPTHYYGKHPHQEVNLHSDASQYEIYRPFVKRAWRVDSAELMPEIIEKAFQKDYDDYKHNPNSQPNHIRVGLSITESTFHLLGCKLKMYFQSENISMDLTR